MQTEQLLQELGITQWRLRAAALSNAKLDGDVAPKDVEQADIQANSQLDGQASAKNDTGCWPLAFNLLEGRQSGILQGRTWGALYKPEVLSNAEQTLLSNILQALSVQPQVVTHIAEVDALPAQDLHMLLVFGSDPLKQLLRSVANTHTVMSIKPQQFGANILPVLALPSLSQLLTQPEQKAPVWKALKQAIALSQQ